VCLCVSVCVCVCLCLCVSVCVCVSRIITGGDDGVIKIWDFVKPNAKAGVATVPLAGHAVNSAMGATGADASVQNVAQVVP
jgi:hypothetical protein